MELAGHKCMGFCEWDKFATASYTSMHLITEEQRAYLATLDLKKRQKEILKDEYRNGEWYRADIRSVRADDVPRADCWCFGAPCQDFSVAGKRAGLDGDRSSLVREIFRLCREKGENKPEWLIYENVKGMLSSNRGFDFLAILIEMGELGYDIEWQLFNTKNFGIPQNRERVYIVGHYRAKGRKQVFPLVGADAENSYDVMQIGKIKSERNNKNQYRVYDKDGLGACLNCMGGGGLEPHTAIPIFASRKNGISGETKVAGTLMARDYKGIGNQDGTAVCIPVLTPDRAEKRQNGRRFKDNGEESFTLTSQDRHGVAIKGDISVPVIWYDKYQCYIAIRKLTPRECFRLQGWEDKYFDRAQFVNSDSQLYKQAGNGVTVSVIEAIARKMK
jgi:DNA (cytosine-5)-methyltransferase 1